MTRKLLAFLIAVGVLSTIYLAFNFFGRPSSPSSSIIRPAIDHQLFDLKETPKPVEESARISLIAVGDISFSRGVARAIKRQDPNYPFLRVKDLLKTADLVFGNLEGPITPGREIQSGEMIFRADPGVEKALKEAGLTIVNLANNHLPDFGSQGIKDTLNYLDRSGIKHVGAGENENQAYQPIFLEVSGIKLAFLGYNDTDVVPQSYGVKGDHAGTAFMDIDKMAQGVREAKARADMVIVSMHSGNEYTANPNQSQTNFAHAAIDAGAEIVIGHHAHWVQKAEIYQGKYIFYGLGNFVMDQMWSQETREGLILKIYFNKKGVAKIEPTPVLIEDYSQPRILEGEAVKVVLERLGLPDQGF